MKCCDSATVRHWRDNGVPAETTSPAWTPKQRDACVERGCHHSANKHSAFLREEMATFMEDKFWMVLPYQLVCELVKLMLWPAAVKEERERKPRLLCDHSWPNLSFFLSFMILIALLYFGVAVPICGWDLQRRNPDGEYVCWLS